MLLILLSFPLWRVDRIVSATLALGLGLASIEDLKRVRAHVGVLELALLDPLASEILWLWSNVSLKSSFLHLRVSWLILSNLRRISLASVGPRPGITTRGDETGGLLPGIQRCVLVLILLVPGDVAEPSRPTAQTLGLGVAFGSFLTRHLFAVLILSFSNLRHLCLHV